MFTRKALNNYINEFLGEMKSAGYAPSRVVLFGSYAKGKPNALSDVDLAIWDKRFVGLGSVDILPILPIISKYNFLELHPFHTDETSDNNAFIEEILKHGIDLTAITLNPERV